MFSRSSGIKSGSIKGFSILSKVAQLGKGRAVECNSLNPAC
jgi:hypothetical protein